VPRGRVGRASTGGVSTPGVSAVSESRARAKANAFLTGALGTVAPRGPTARCHRPTTPRRPTPGAQPR